MYRVDGHDASCGGGRGGRKVSYFVESFQHPTTPTYQLASPTYLLRTSCVLAAYLLRTSYVPPTYQLTSLPSTYQSVTWYQQVVIQFAILSQSKTGFNFYRVECRQVRQMSTSVSRKHFTLMSLMSIFHTNSVSASSSSFTLAVPMERYPVWDTPFVHGVYIL